MPSRGPRTLAWLLVGGAGTAAIAVALYQRQRRRKRKRDAGAAAAAATAVAGPAGNAAGTSRVGVNAEFIRRLKVRAETANAVLFAPLACGGPLVTRCQKSPRTPLTHDIVSPRLDDVTAPRV